MTTAQEGALDHILDVISEHFESGVCSVEGSCVEAEKEVDNKGHIVAVFHGGAPAAVGLCEFAKRQIMGELKLDHQEE